MLILVLEASTASAKAMLYKSGEGIIGILQKNYSSDAGDTVTFDADKIMAETMLAGKQLLEQKGINHVDMVATCSIWSHSLLMLDRNRKPISRLSTWADTKASLTTEKYRKDIQLFTSLYKRTGCPIHVTYTLWKYMYEKESGNVKDVSFIASMPEYLFLKLTGEFAVSKSTTSAGGFLNIHTLNWDEEALKLAGIDDTMLPKLVDSEYTATLTKEAAGILGLKEGIPVLITGADGCMNQIAAGAFSDNIMTLSVGTSAAMRISTEKPVLANYPSTWCYVGVENMWIAGSATAGAGNCVDWMGKKVLGFNGGITLKELDKGAEEALLKGNAPIFLPFLAGERCPGWDDTKSGMMCEMRINNDIYDLYYATLEGVLFNLKHCYDITVPIVGQPPKFISISGGIEKSPFWLSMAASIFGLPVYVDGLLHASLLGTAYMGLKAAGEIASVKDIKPLMKNRCEPDCSKKEFYTERFEKYLKYYRQQIKE
ncbi:MAG: gluconokinase [Petroclostridium sp.]|jgi:gluconokinase|uniref:gluconokinase n=1 Tax=Petroclostridium xylanilyticum TaxID=1792311 RepID=UPI000B98AA6F|nr:FGGY family carbohydrate kinase [Petroclostridium xylanilyticum]MBZ4645129.1 gluconokinase [Clostridia bacterium]MDK2811752.1 gluconokinase [Petroclostridium sp.]